MKIIIAGSRDFYDYELLFEKCSEIISKMEAYGIQIVSGGAKGADILGEKFAREKGYGLARFIPKWEIGKQAGMIRNAEMADYADVLIAFWNGSSKGTVGMIRIAKKKGLKIHVIQY